ncbi:MAG: MATE family efflux transporter [Angelakisella sp.]
MKTNHYFETMHPTKLFVRCAIPSMISMAAISLCTVVDGIFVGRFIGENALVAVNLVMPLIMISFALSDMIAVGSSVQIAIKLGEKDEKQASAMFSLFSLIIMMISLVVGIVAFFFAAPLVQLMGADAQVSLLAEQYTKVFAIFSPVIMISFALDNYLRICGRIHYSLWVNVFSAFANIVLDWLFIAKWGMGIGSAALATCLSLMCSTILCLIPFIRGKLQLKFRKPVFSLQLIKNVIANGSSEFFSNISGSAFMAITNVVLLRISGATAVAAFSIIMYVDSVVKPMLFGMSDSVQPAISYNLGAGNLKRTWALEHRAQFFSCLLSVLSMVVMLTGGHWLISLFTPPGNLALLEMGITGMRIFALSYLVSWLPTVSGAFFTALNRPVFSLLISFGNTIVFPLLGIALLVPVFGVNGVWLTPLLSGLLSLILCLVLLRRVAHSSAPGTPSP